MNPLLLELLADPQNKASLRYHDGKLINPITHQTFPVVSGIPTFIASQKVSLRDKQTAWLYNRLAFAYDATLSLGHKARLASEGIVRQRYVAALAPKARAKVLEIGCGTAANRELLPASNFYVGLDSSLNMLRRAIKKIEHASIQAEFVHGDAHTLPFRSKSFDILLSMGSLQHFSKPQAAALEMWRVRKTGGVIHILDEVPRFPFFNSKHINQEMHKFAQSLFPEAQKWKAQMIEHSDYFALHIS